MCGWRRAISAARSRRSRRRTQSWSVWRRRTRCNSGWQRDLSVSWNKLGSVRVAQGDLVGALAAFGADLAIAERLAAADPGNAGWQRDMIVSHVKLSEIATAMHDQATARVNLEAALAMAQALAASGRLAPRDAFIPGMLGERLAKLDR